MGRAHVKREGLFERKILGNYPWIISGNYYLVYHDDAEKLRFIGILAHPEIVEFQKLPFCCGVA